jgi:hypothetical protein
MSSASVRGVERSHLRGVSEEGKGRRENDVEPETALSETGQGPQDAPPVQTAGASVPNSALTDIPAEHPPAGPGPGQITRRWQPPPNRRVPTRESSLSSSCLFTVPEPCDFREDVDISTHGAPEPKDVVSGFLPFDQCDVEFLEDDEALLVDYASVRTTTTALLHAAMLEGKPVTSKRLKDNLAGDPMSLEFTALLLEAKALTALNRDGGHPAIPVLHGMSLRQTWTPVLVMEALTGPTLAAFFESNRTPVKRVGIPMCSFYV